MLPIPKKYKLTCGAAEGHSELTAFDAALLQAGIGNVNLVKVSSILPPQAEFTPDLQLPFGGLVPTAYGCIISEEPGAIISAAIAVGISEDSFGVIMELSGNFSKAVAEEKISAMVKESFAMRNMTIKELKVLAVEHQVEKIGCALAAAPLWY